MAQLAAGSTRLKMTQSGHWNRTDIAERFGLAQVTPYFSIAARRSCAEHRGRSYWWMPEAVVRQTTRNVDVGTQVRSLAQIA
jgi:hypothetical protein